MNASEPTESPKTISRRLSALTDQKATSRTSIPPSGSRTADIPAAVASSSMFRLVSEFAMQLESLSRRRRLALRGGSAAARGRPKEGAAVSQSSRGVGHVRRNDLTNPQSTRPRAKQSQRPMGYVTAGSVGLGRHIVRTQSPNPGTYYRKHSCNEGSDLDKQLEGVSTL